MDLHYIDLGIILLYLIATIVTGYWVSKRASKNIQSYFLGGNSLPWYFLGVSNASGMFDIAAGKNKNPGSLGGTGACKI